MSNTTYYLDMGNQLWKDNKVIELRDRDGSAYTVLRRLDDTLCQFGLAAFSADNSLALGKVLNEVGYRFGMTFDYEVTEEDFENEVKLAVPSEMRFGEIRRQVESEGTLVLNTSERNYVVDRNNELVSTDRLLRLRNEDIISPSGKRCTLTYKGPNEEGQFKNKLEINVNVTNFQTTSQFFKALGFTVQEKYWKHRTVHDIEGVKVFLDRAHGFSLDMPTSYHWRKFVEIEGSDDEIKRTIFKLGLEDLEVMTKSYGKLL